MALYGKVLNNVIVEYQEFATMDNQAGLPPNKPKWWPVVEVNAAYDPVTQVRSGPIDAIDTPNARITRTYTVRGKNVDEINSMREGKINGVHSEATKRLVPTSGAAMSQQIMALTRLMQTIYKYTDRSAWSTQDKNIVQQAINRLQMVVANRVVEDTKVAELQALTDPAAINNYNPTTGWPA
jgi:hypothetical protein